MKFSAAETMSVMVTSYSLANPDRFTLPFVALPDFELRTAKFREIAGSDMIILLPYLKKNQSEEWEQFSQTHSYWIEEGLEQHGLGNIYAGQVPSLIHDMFKSGEPNPANNNSGRVAPVW